MKMNTSTDYAIKSLIFLAERGGVVPSTKISQHLAVSQRYLLQIGAKLRDGHIVRVSKGADGGYQLIPKPEDITIYDIILLMEGTTILIPSSAAAEKEIRENHAINAVYQLLQSIWDAFLREVSLDMLLCKSHKDIKSFLIERLRVRLDSIVVAVAEKMSLEI